MAREIPAGAPATAVVPAAEAAPAVAAVAAMAAPGTPAVPAAGSPASLRGLRRGGLLFSASSFLGIGLGFLASMAMTRAAPPAEVGSYLLLLQSSTALGLILQLGLVQGVLRFAPVSRGAGGEEATCVLRRRLLGLQLAIWAVFAPAAALLWPALALKLNAPELAGAWGWLLATAMLASFSRLLDAYLRAFRLYTASAVLTYVLPRALTLAGFVALAAAAAGATSWTALIAVFLGAQLAATLGYALLLPATSAGEGSEPRAAEPAPGMWAILLTTTPIGVRAMAALLMTSSDLWVLKWAGSHEDVAIYGVVGRFIAVVGALSLAANFLLPQEFSVLHADGRKAEIERLARTAATAVAMLSLVALAGIVLFGRPLIQLAFGEAYVNGWLVLLILAAGSFWDAASGSAGYLLQMTGHQMAVLRPTLVAAAANLLLALLLAPHFGGAGVATATALTLIGLNLANVRAARKLVGVRTFVYTDPREWRHVLDLLLRGKSRG